MSDNHVPPTIRKAVSSVMGSPQVLALEPAMEYEGAVLKFVTMTHRQRESLESKGVKVGRISGSINEEQKSAMAHLRPKR